MRIPRRRVPTLPPSPAPSASDSSGQRQSGTQKRFTLNDLIGAQDLEPKTGTLGRWRITGARPRVLLPYAVPAGWVRLELKCLITTPASLTIRADAGEGFEKAPCLKRIEVINEVEQVCYLRLPYPSVGLCLDVVAEEGEIRFERFRLKRVGPVALLWSACAAKLRLVRKYWHTGQALKTALRLFVRGKWLKLGEKLFSGLEGPTLEQSREPYDEEQAYARWMQERESIGYESIVVKPGSRLPHFTLLLDLAGSEGPLPRRAIQSIQAQSYPAWELLLAGVEGIHGETRDWIETLAAEERRIHLVRKCHDQTVDQRLNQSLEVASGDYVGLINWKDALPAHALSMYAQQVLANPVLDVVYGDEDQIRADCTRFAPFFKPAWSPEYLSQWFYTGNACIYRTGKVRERGGIGTTTHANHPYDLALRMTAAPCSVGHISDVLYHRGQELDVHPELLRDCRAIRGTPRVSIIIASACRQVQIRRKRDYYLLNCLRTIEKSTYAEHEIVVLHGENLQAEVAGELARLKVIQSSYSQPFNWSRAMNHGATLASGDYLLFLNDDMEIVTVSWIEEMLRFAQQPEIGVVGAKLLFPSGRLQHTGMALQKGRPVHLYYSYPRDHPGYFNNHRVARNCCAVTGACLMTSRQVFEQLGGFSTDLPLNYNDVDYCLRALEAGFRNIVNPSAELIHFELGTRTPAVSPEEEALFQKRWGSWRDPYFNPNLATNSLEYRIGAPPPSIGRTLSQGSRHQREVEMPLCQ